VRALIVTYVFPPTGGAGVGRPLKMVKYLGHHGVEVSVLTAANPSVPVQDHSLLADVPAAVSVTRARTLEPGYAMKKAGWAAASGNAGKGEAGGSGGGGGRNRARPSLGARLRGLAVAAGRQALVPDPQILWQPAAQAALARRLVAGRDDAMLISAPPFSQFFLAPLARLRPGMGVVLDYRDEWSTVSSIYEMQGSFSARAGAVMETALLRAAHVVTTATTAFRDNLLRRFPFLDPGRVLAIPNGYDSEDFPDTLGVRESSAAPAALGGKLTVTYAGTLFKLTSARGLIGAVRRLHARAPALARHLRLRFLGRIVDTELDMFAGTEDLGVERAGYVPHDSVARELCASDIALCLLDEVPHVERIYPAKIFELMHLADRFGLRVLTLSPPGVLADLVTEHAVGPVLPPRDEEAIASFLEAELRAFVDGHPPPRPRPVGTERYHRRALAGEFARALTLARDLARA
jgi:hypothetical protein